MRVYVGLDIGGTKFMAAAADEAGRVLASTRAATPLDLEEGLSLLHTMIVQVARGHSIVAIGAAIGGPMDYRTGVVSPLHQPQWRQVPLGRIMRERWNCPFHADVDTNVAALGEYHLGEETARRFLYLTISTGMGGGFLVDGRVYRGMNGEHPEIGHQAVPFRCAYPQNVSCECGCNDCLEGLVSGNGIRRIYGKPAEILSESEWDEVAWNLGQGLRNLAAIYLPEVIVLGGGVAHGRGQRLLDPAAAVMREHLKIVPAPRIRLSGHGYDTALMGALAVARGALAEENQAAVAAAAPEAAVPV